MLKFNGVLLLYCLMNCVLFIEAKIPKYMCEQNLVNIDTQAPINNVAEECPDCMPKCCAKNEILISRINGTKYPKCGNPASMNTNANYNIVKFYKFDEMLKVKNKTEQFLSKKKFLDFNLMHNKMFDKEDCVDKIASYPFKGRLFTTYILENAKAATELQNHGWSIRESAYFCTDLLYSEKVHRSVQAIFVAKEKGETKSDQYMFMFIASLISAFFLVLVFLVYSVLPQLRRLSDLLLMAYVASLFLMYIMKAALVFNPVSLRCQIAGPIFYFSFLSSLFWLNIMSFDIWWTFRAQRYQRATNRQGILVKFSWYSLYAWGAPLAITIISVIIYLKRQQLSSTVKNLQFGTCMDSRVAVIYYLILPAGVITVGNVTLFVMTVYNIWLINKEINKFNASGGNTNKNKSRFRTYIKLSLLMGVSWILEIIPVSYEGQETPEWLDILTASFNFLIGFIIFLLFVVNKKTLKMLFKRFNIKCRWLDRELNLNPSGRSTATKSSTTHNESYNHTKSTDSDMEMYDTEVSMDPKYQNEKFNK